MTKNELKKIARDYKVNRVNSLNKRELLFVTIGMVEHVLNDQTTDEERNYHQCTLDYLRKQL